ncbi:RimK/LysX family protein [Candidatus Minimicrobia naudis]|uniref:RimK/LysX family protein n=1 Tax=Candidatus Minimicrobia naudis TaxID=2841263 RepID=A0A8F1MCA4_9BACT|nr:RimK/LysX family protein [Candidatus Minimicrobia naudis]
MKEKAIIGSTEFVDFGERAQKVPAKIDTGVDSSAVWASNIRVDEDGVLKFSLFGEGSPYYNGKVFKGTDYSVARVRSAMGHDQIRYRTHFWVKLGGRKIKMLMNLSDRSKNEFPVLIGRRSVSGKFLVDVSRKNVRRKKPSVTASLNDEVNLNPYEFYKKYHQKGEEK